jgi:hypothetical protein
MSHVVWRIEVFTVPAPAYMSIFLTSKYASLGTHVGNLRLTIMPAGHGFVGNALVSGNRVLMSWRQVYVS